MSHASAHSAKGTFSGGAYRSWSISTSIARRRRSASLLSLPTDSRTRRLPDRATTWYIGLGRHVHALANSLVMAGHHVTVVTRHAPGAPLEEYAPPPMPGLQGVRIVRAPEDRRAALVAVGEFACEQLGVALLGDAPSGLPGPAGNRESFAWLAESGRGGAITDVEAAARRVEP